MYNMEGAWWYLPSFPGFLCRLEQNIQEPEDEARWYLFIWEKLETEEWDRNKGDTVVDK